MNPIGKTTNSIQFCMDQNVRVDLSGGQGRSWCDVDADSLPADIAQEIECEMIDGGKQSCRDFVASNGQHYRW